ncbi:exodeoxyribonuclease VII small subunit [Desulfuromonas sp. AOP6]|uniref:exodeoxyribonuclease VII small subunit n=1 Tax=Desulfuromonas sp. AOP6 TaxID=1566351 RepID=UPI001276069D|nr:exodeoxyribonuclease VII small subunit [Desulfuromonas sp. AOP6]BCA79376.1 exodeoxyribonuclease 7 small subunit [Desulfuromonas sp. AOP6]
MAKKDSFEKALKSLEKAVERLESGDLALEEALEYFEAGMVSAKQCQKYLKDVETKVELLMKDREGNFSTEPFDKTE